MKVVVVGAGIAGLATAAGLAGDGHDVTVLERAAAPANLGSGLSLFGNGFTALRHLGLEGRVRAVCAPHPPQGSAGLARPDGRWLSRQQVDPREPVRIVHRAELHAALADALPAGTIRWGVEVSGRDPGGVRDTLLHLHRADLVVGADGLRSRTRQGWPGEPPITYAGYGAWRGITDGPVDLGGRGGETVGRGLRFGCAPLRDGRAYWFAVRNTRAPEREPTDLDTCRRLVGGWHDPIPALLAGTDPDRVSWLPIHELRRPVRQWWSGNTVLVGDAAHAMTPNLGQGANQGLEDAATLQACLAGVRGHDLGAALDRYQRIRGPRVRAIAARSRAMGAVMQARHAPTAWLRDTAVLLAPDRLAAEGLRRLQDWEPPDRAAPGPSQK